VDLPEALSPVLFTADASRIWVVGLDGRLVRWTLSAKPARDASIVVAKEGASLIDARAARDGRRLIAFDSHGRVSLVDAEERTIKGDAEGDPSGLFWAAISGEGHFVAASGIQQNVRIWSLPSLRLVSQWRSEERVTNGCFSPDERTLALTLKSGTLELHPLGDPLHAMVRHTTSGTAYGLSFHPTEPRLFVGGQDGIVHVFNTADWTEMTQLAAAYSGTEPGMIYSEAASADGSALAAYTESGLIRLWRR
jgi:WD40 repeat protein